MRLELSLLGTPRIGNVPASAVFTRRRAIALLAYLAATRKAHGREHLADLLGDSASDPHLPKHLSNALTELRQKAGEHISADRHAVSICGTDLQLDVARFESGLNPESLVIEEAEAALNAYRGDFLAGFSLPGAPLFQEWLMFERVRLQALYVRGLRAVLAAHQGGGDYGRMLSLAQRLSEMEPWSDAAEREVMRYLGRTGQRAAGIAHFEAFAARLQSDLGIKPEAETVEGYQRLRASVLMPLSQLPTGRGAFVGRADELKHVVGLLTDPYCRVVSIVGLGGAGKSRLAVEAARVFTRPSLDLQEQPFAHGIFFVSLSAFSATERRTATLSESVHRLATLIASTMGVHVDSAAPAVPQLQDYLRGKSLLLVIDGAERVPSTVDALIRTAGISPSVKFLLTSRRRIRIADEYVVELRGLGLTNDVSRIEESDAGAFFLSEFRRKHDDTELSDDDRKALVQVTSHLAGLPLPMILAAHYGEGMGLPALAEGIDGSLDFLASNAREVRSDQRDFHAILHDTVAGLPDQDKTVLRKLAVFERSFDAQAALAVADASLQQLMSLRENALIMQDSLDRYMLLAPVRRHELNLLERNSAEAEETRSRYVRYCAGRIERALYTGDWGIDADELEADAEELVVAWEWAASRIEVDLLSELRICLALWCERTGRIAEGVALLDFAADQLRAGVLKGNALAQSVLQAVLAEEGRLFMLLGNEVAAGALFAEAFDIPHTAAKDRQEAYDLFRRTQVLFPPNGGNGSGDKAQRSLEKTLAMARKAGSKNLEILIRARLGTEASPVSARQDDVSIS